MEIQRRSRLARLIQEEVQAQLKRYAVARTREEFINRLTEVLGPALSHCYRYTLAAINKRTDQTEKWQQQEEDFLRRFSERLLEPTKAKKLDRKKAVEQSLNELLQTDEARRRIESLNFRKAYKLKTLAPLPENAHQSFLARVREIVNTIFPS